MMDAVLDNILVNRYPFYKTSGAEWLGEIPEHWQTLSNKYIFQLKKNEVGKRASEYVLLSLTLNGVIKRDMENPQGKFPAEFDTYQEVKKGDFIFCLFDVEETPRTVGLSPFDGMITGAYTVMEPSKDFNKKFLYYFYLNLDSDKRMKPLYKGLRNTIPKEAFFSFKTLVPPTEEQTAIAAFLDRKTAQIDKAIAQKEKLIELLQERRQILIHKAVTRGLIPDVRMKDSGVEWIGEIPEHWEVKKIKHIGTVRSGFAKSSGNEITQGMQMPYLRVANVQDGYLDLENMATVRLTLSRAEGYMLKKGDLLMNEGGDIDKLGRGCIWNNEVEPCLHQNHVFAVRFNKGINPEWVNAVTFAEYSRRYFILHAKKTTNLASIASSSIREFPVVMPPEFEQNKVLQYLKNVDNKFNHAFSKIARQILKIKEAKSTLINAAVTGKIKVS